MSTRISDGPGKITFQKTRTLPRIYTVSYDNIKINSFLHFPPKNTQTGQHDYNIESHDTNKLNILKYADI